MGVHITCCNCNASFDERSLAGTWLDRRCPRCNARLSEGAYDKAARELLEARPRGLSLADVNELDVLAYARFYVSEWFRLANAGRGSEAPDRGLSGLRPEYGPDGRFSLRPDDADRSPDLGLGVSAEYFVFDALRAEARRAKSPLAGAFIAPNLVFPWLPGQKPQQWGATERGEVDCIVLARSCAVIVEVKRRNHHVKVSGDFKHVRVRNDDGSFRSASEVLEQVENEAGAFMERQHLYPKDRVFRLVVFVEPYSFSCPMASFRDNTLVSYLDADGCAHFLPAIRKIARSLAPVATREEVRDLGYELLKRFGHTEAPHGGSILIGDDPAFARRLKAADGMFDAIKAKTRDSSSPLHGARLLRNLSCSVQLGKRGAKLRDKETRIAGLLITRTHAVFIDVKRWYAHVNTHSPFATVYAGDVQAGAKRVDDAIRHDWDLDAIGYENRSGSLTLAKFVSRRTTELERHRDRNRVCMMTVFVNPVSFSSDGLEFKQRAFIGYWSRKSDNVIEALERLVASAEPVMSQGELDALADEISAIGR